MGIKTYEAIADEFSDATLSTILDRVLEEKKISRNQLIDIKYVRNVMVRPYYDDDRIQNGTETYSEESALIIWEE